MDQDNDLKYFVGLENVQHLLAVYGIEDDSKSLSQKISKWLDTLLNTHKRLNLLEVHATYEELLQAKQLQHLLESCLNDDITIKAKGFPNIKLTSKSLKNRILSLLEGVLCDTTEIDMIIAQSHSKNTPSNNQQLGFYATSLLSHTFKDSDITSLTKSEQYSLIYDILFKAIPNKVFRDDCKHEGYNNGGREKYLLVQDWIKAFKNYYKN